MSHKIVAFLTRGSAYRMGPANIATAGRFETAESRVAKAPKKKLDVFRGLPYLYRPRWEHFKGGMWASPADGIPVWFLY